MPVKVCQVDSQHVPLDCDNDLDCRMTIKPSRYFFALECFIIPYTCMGSFWHVNNFSKKCFKNRLATNTPLLSRVLLGLEKEKKIMSLQCRCCMCGLFFHNNTYSYRSRQLCCLENHCAGQRTDIWH